MVVTAAELIRTDPPSVNFARDDELSKAIEGLGGHDFRTFRVSAGQAKTKEELLDRFALALKFPSYFGRNWDALADNLADMEWAPANGYVIVVDEAQQLFKEIPDAGGRLVAVAEQVAEEWRKRGKPFHLFFVYPRESTPTR